MLLELAVFHPESVEIAARRGVDRIELCTDYAAGGLSPDMDFFSFARKKFSGPIMVMIRPRPGNFYYAASELGQMTEAIRRFDAAGADGFVFGCLKDKEIDVLALEFLMKAAGKKPVTFHRAIDEVDDYEAGIRQLIASGCQRVLTSGNATNALEGAETLASLTEIYSHQIHILAGGGIRSTNISLLKQVKGLAEVHSAAITGAGETADETEVLRLLAEVYS